MWTPADDAELATGLHSFSSVRGKLIWMAECTGSNAVNLCLRYAGLNQLHAVYRPQVEIALVSLPIPGRRSSISPALKEWLSYLRADLITASAN